MGKSRRSGGGNSQSSVQNITDFTQKQVDTYLNEIKNMSDEEVMNAYREFTNNWVKVNEWDGVKKKPKFIRSQSEDIISSEGITRGDIQNISQKFVNLNGVMLQIGTEMLKRSLENEYGYSDVPYYDVRDGKVEFHPFTPTKE